MKVYLRLLSYLKPYKGTILLTWCLSILVVAMQAVSIWVGAAFIEKLLMNNPLGAIKTDTGLLASYMDWIADAILKRSTPFRSLIAGIMVFIVAGFLTAFFRVLKIYLFTKINQKILINIRTEMFFHITHLNLSFSRKYKPGNISSLFIKDVDQLENAIIDVTDRIFMQPLRLLLAVVLMLSLSIELTIWAMAFLIASSFVVHFTGNKIESLSQRLMEKVANLQGHLTEYLSTVALARCLGREEYENESFSNNCYSLAESTTKFRMVMAIVPQIISNLFILSGGLLLLIGGYKVLIEQTLDGSTLIKMILLLPMAIYPLEALASLYVSVRISIASAKRVFELLDEERTYQDPPDACEPEAFRHEIVLKNICYFSDGNSIIKNISFKIPYGKTIVIYGPSGAGKTTILNLIAGFDAPDKGSILIDRVDLRQLKKESWHKRLGIVIQESVLLNGTVRENLLYACPDANDEKLMRVLKESLLWDKDCVFPHGLETKVGNRGEMISGGERQRLSIARSLLKEPDIFLFDEVTAMLDKDSRISIRNTICSIAKGKTIVIVTHDPYLLDIADIKVKIDSGELVEYTKFPSKTSTN